MVVAADSGEENNRQRNETQGNPRAFNEFRSQHDNDGDTGDERPEPVDESALQPVPTAIFPPVHDHAGLREREGQKGADSIEGDEPTGDRAEKDEKAATEYRQVDDAVRIA